MNISNLSVPRKKCLLVAITTAFCWIFLVSTKAGVLGARVPETTSATATATSPKQASKEETETTNIDHEVIDLTSKNFGSTVGIADGNVWLIEFYTPGCSHCRNFATAYQSIAKTFHSDPKSKVRVARVDCTVEKALLTRFSIQGFPSFFLVSGWDVYEFEENRTTMNLIKFAEHGHKKKKPIPFLNSPMGPMGLLQGTLIFVGTRAIGILEYLKEKYGISPIISGIVICMVGVFGGMISIILLTIFSTPRQKID